MYLKRMVFSLTMTIIIIKKKIKPLKSQQKKPSIQVEFAKKKIARKLRGVIRFQVSLGNSIPK
jgi:hypothetical protein